jgi:hypothetical protein
VRHRQEAERGTDAWTQAGNPCTTVGSGRKPPASIPLVNWRALHIAVLLQSPYPTTPVTSTENVHLPDSSKDTTATAKINPSEKMDREYRENMKREFEK